MTVRSETRGRTAVIHVERPEKRNAIDSALTRALDEALNRFQDDAACWVGIVTGTADVFCAGTDVLAGPGEPTPRGGEYGVIRRTHVKPLIAAVEGLALGGGAGLIVRRRRSARLGVHSRRPPQ